MEPYGKVQEFSTWASEQIKLLLEESFNHRYEQGELYKEIRLLKDRVEELEERLGIVREEEL